MYWGKDAWSERGKMSELGDDGWNRCRPEGTQEGYTKCLNSRCCAMTVGGQVMGYLNVRNWEMAFGLEFQEGKRKLLNQERHVKGK